MLSFLILPSVMASPEISTSSEGPITTISINRNSRRNAIDGKTATLLYDAFLAFERDPDAKVAVLHGEGEVHVLLLRRL